MAIYFNYPADKANALCNLIDEQPTAYDVDKVVERLEDRSALWSPVGWRNSYEILALDVAIKTVKGGGANG